MKFTYSPVPRLLCGPHPLRPGREILDSLLASGVTCFIDLTEPHELSDYQLQISNLRYLNLSIPDFSVPTPAYMVTILDALDNALASGHTVYLHCHGGRGRTGTVVGCWLARQGMTGEQAIARIAELRGDHESPETDEQRTFVLNWCDVNRVDKVNR